MPVSERRKILEEAARLTRSSGSGRFVPFWLRFRLWLRADENDPPGRPGDVLPGLFGGLFDKVLRAYVDGAEPEDERQIAELLLHPGQVEAILGNHDGLMRVLALGAPGAGKTRLLSLKQAVWSCQRPNTTGGLVGATRDRVEILWTDALATLPKHWIERISDYKREIFLHNGRKLEFVAAKEPSKLVGSPIQGRSWRDAVVDETQNIHDRVQMDIDERGRRAGTKYTIFESATRVGHHPHFENRLEMLYGPESKFHRLIRLNPMDNSFTPLDYWERFRGSYTEREWNRRMLSLDVAPENIAYGAWSRENIRPAPRSGNMEDVTRLITAEMYGNLPGAPRGGWEWIVGTDWGTLCHASIWLKAFRDPRVPGELLWWAFRETYTRSAGDHSHGSGSATAADHIRNLVRFANVTDFIVIADPGINTKDTSKSDYHLARNEGAFVRPAHHKPIEVKHRVSMLNVLCHDSKGKRRWFIDCDGHGKPYCTELAKNIRAVEIGPDGKLEGNRKNYSDPSHGPAAVSYGVFPWERIRGLTTFEAVTGADEDPVLLQHRKILLKRNHHQDRNDRR